MFVCCRLAETVKQEKNKPKNKLKKRKEKSEVNLEPPGIHTMVFAALFERRMRSAPVPEG